MVLINGQYRHHSHSASTTRGLIPLRSKEVVPLTEKECRILGAISYRVNRYTVYNTPGKLAWGVGLKVGDTVLTKLSSLSLPYWARSSGGGGQKDFNIAATIRWCGCVPTFVGERYMFGAEIRVSVLSSRV